MSPYESIWLRPRATFEKVRDTGALQPLKILPIVILALVLSIDMVVKRQPFLSINFLYMVIGTFVLTLPILLILFVWLNPWLITSVGKIWGGYASQRQIANVLALSMTPLSVQLTYQIAVLAMGGMPWLGGFIGAPLLHLWSFGLAIFGVAICQRFSFGFALLNLVVAEIPFYLLAMIYALS